MICKILNTILGTAIVCSIIALIGTYIYNQTTIPNYKSKITLRYTYLNNDQKVEIINHSVSIVTNLGYKIDKIEFDEKSSSNGVIRVDGIVK